MKYLKLVFCMVFIIAARLSPAQWNYDSLSRQWSRSSSENIEKFNAFIDSWHRLALSDTDSATYHALSAYRLGQQLEDEWFIAVASSKLAIEYRLIGNVSKALNSCNESLSLLYALGDSLHIFEVYSTVANIYSWQGLYIRSIKKNELALEIAARLGIDQGKNKMNLAYMHQNVGNYETALKYMVSVDTSSSDFSANNKALYLLNIARIYDKLNRNTLAKEANEMAIESSRSINYLYIEPSAHYNLGELYRKMKNMDSARYHFSRSIAISSEKGPLYPKLASYMKLAIILKSHDLDSAITLAKEAQLVFEEFGLIDNMLESADLLYELYNEKGDGEQALIMLEISNSLRDSLDKKTAKYELLVKEHEKEFKAMMASKVSEFNDVIASKQEDTDRYYWMWMSSIGIIVVLIVVGTSVYLRVVRRREKLMRQFNVLKQNALAQLPEGADEAQTLLNRNMLEQTIDRSLNETDWKVLKTLYSDPYLSNNDLADKVCLSFQGISSSLKRMYRYFNIDTRSNMKIALIKKCMQISTENRGVDTFEFPTG